jgi:hypothetical protein
MDYQRPRKIYCVTSNGQNVLDLTEESLNLICRKLAAQPAVEQSNQPAVTIMAKVPAQKQTV